jgi:hypothetical protein
MTSASKQDVELPKPYLWMSRYGPVLLCVVGVGMVLGAMLLDRPDAVLVTLIVMGVGSLVAGVLLPRIKGPVEVGTQGVKAAVESVAAIDAIKTVAAAAAETVAETTIPDQPDKDAKVARQVQMVSDAVTLWLQSQPRILLNLSHQRSSFGRTTLPSGFIAPRGTDSELKETYSRLLDALDRQLDKFKREP